MCRSARAAQPRPRVIERRRCLGLVAALLSCAPEVRDAACPPSAEAVTAGSARLEELWRVGDQDHEGLASPVAFAAGPSAQLAIVDFALGEVLVIDSAGVWQGPWAGKGRGPGELTNPAAATWRGDELVVLDLVQAKVEFYRDGSQARAPLAVRADFLTPVLMAGEVPWVGVGPDGSVLLQYPATRSTTAPDSVDLLVLMLRPGATRADTLAQIRAPSFVPDPRSVLAMPGSPVPRVAIATDGRIALASEDGRYLVRVRDASGAVTATLCREVHAHELAPEERGVGAVTEGWERAATELAAAAAPRRLAAIGRVLVASSGEVIVDRRRPAPFTDQSHLGVAGGAVDVFDREGRYRGELRVPDGVRLQAVVGERAWGLHLGPNDEPIVIGYRIRWQ